MILVGFPDSVPSAFSGVQRVLLRSLAVTLLVPLVGIPVLLLLRRLAGAPLEPLAPVGMVAAAGIGWLLGMLGRAAWWGAAPRPLTRRHLVVLFIPTAALLLLGAALWLPATAAAGLAAFGSVVVAGEALAWTAGSRLLWLREPVPVTFGGVGEPSRASRSSGAADERAASLPGADQGGESLPGSSGGDELSEEELFPEGLLQQLTRSRLDERTEMLHGLLRAEFEPGQRQQVLHLAFTPPLATRPRVEAHQADGPAAQIKATDVQTYGVRLEVRLAAVARAPESVWLEVEIVGENAS